VLYDNSLKEMPRSLKALAKTTLNQIKWWWRKSYLIVTF